MGADRSEGSGIRLRPAAAADADEIAAIWWDGWGEAHEGRVPDALLAHRSAADLRDRVPALLATTTVATDGGTVAGFAVVLDDEVDQIYVARRFRGSGAAERLLGSAEEQIARRYDRAWLAVVAGNGRARRFYEQRGWRDAGAIEFAAWTTDGGTIPVPCRRYEKLVRGPGPASEAATASWR
jgi:ribosomal protein S18 acetylase RimI-like enzyme